MAPGPRLLESERPSKRNRATEATAEKGECISIGTLDGGVRDRTVTAQHLPDSTGQVSAVRAAFTTHIRVEVTPTVRHRTGTRAECCDLLLG